MQAWSIAPHNIIAENIFESGSKCQKKMADEQYVKELIAEMQMPMDIYLVGTTRYLSIK